MQYVHKMSFIVYENIILLTEHVIIKYQARCLLLRPLPELTPAWSILIICKLGKMAREKKCVSNTIF